MITLKIILLILLLLFVYYNPNGDNFTDAENNQIMISKNLSKGKDLKKKIRNKIDISDVTDPNGDKPYFFIDGDIYAQEHCIDKNNRMSYSNNKTIKKDNQCINFENIALVKKRNLSDDPNNYDNKKICIGQTCVNKEDIRKLKIMAEDSDQVINHNTNQAHRKFRPNYIKNKPITNNDLELVLENKECNPYKNEEKPTFNNVKSPLDCAKKCVQNNLQSIEGERNDYFEYNQGEKKCKCVKAKRVYEDDNTREFKNICEINKININDVCGGSAEEIEKCNQGKSKGVSGTNVYKMNFEANDYSHPKNLLKKAYEELDLYRLDSRTHTNSYGWRAIQYGECTGGFDDFSIFEDYNRGNSHLYYVVNHR